MFGELAMIALSCVLFVTMGLAEAIQEYVPFRLRILTCPKCLTFWSVLAYSLISGEGVVQSVATSFIIAYIALWAALILDAITLLYNYLYEKVTRNQGTSEQGTRQKADADKAGGEAGTTDAMP